MFFLAWFRKLVKDAFIGGVQDAVEELGNLDVQDQDQNPLAALQGRMNALPAPSSNGELKPVKKGK